MFAGISMFWARLGLILAQAVRRRFKRALRRAQNIFMPENISYITIIIITLACIEKKTDSFTNAAGKRQQAL